MMSASNTQHVQTGNSTIIHNLIRAVCVSALLLPYSSAYGQRPNILIISIDDLNDWTGCLGGHPQARTPNIDRLAGRGTLFRNAHCQAPICTPSRASLITGLFPSTTGLYFLQPKLEASRIATRHPHMLQHFADAGYRTMGAGKFVHGGDDGRHYQEYGGSMGGFGPLPDRKLSAVEGLRLWDWGPYPEDESRMPDTKIADWVSDKLKKKHEQPFFLVAGFWRPHVPMYVPKRWFEPFSPDKVKLPQVLKNDQNDLSDYAKTLTIGHPAPRHEWFVKHNAWRDAVGAYLASVAFVDHCAGRVLDALNASSYRDNSIVVLLSDHGWHLGEKQRWAKRSLWNDSTRVPLIIAAPGYFSGRTSDRPVGLIDIFPTLLELTAQSPRADLEGQSLVSLMKDPDANWDRPALTTFGPKNHSLRSTRWHYLRYADGSQELYDHENDPHEWHNLADKSEHLELLMQMRRALPKHNAEPVIGDWQQWEIDAWRKAERLDRDSNGKGNR
jgi:arylsulfatase A-like enzyme